MKGPFQVEIIEIMTFSINGKIMTKYDIFDIQTKSIAGKKFFPFPLMNSLPTLPSRNLAAKFPFLELTSGISVVFETHGDFRYIGDSHPDVIFLSKLSFIFCLSRANGERSVSICSSESI